MTQGNQPINSHITEYLDYYCGLNHAPEFAVLLNGQWGSGKTWLISKYREKLKEREQKCLYISLYGMTKFSEIEYEFFRQLNPLLASKGMVLAGKIAKGFIRGALKIDLNSDGRDDGTVNIQIPDINVPGYLRDADKNILIFDDLERCNIALSDLLGYINYFVEHQQIKVILVANEEKLLKNESYKSIKEKLVGKTFGVSSNLEGALGSFIDEVDDSSVRTFLSDNTDLIQALYAQAQYENLRNLKQIILDFERIFKVLPKKSQSKPEFLQDFLKLLMAFSIEIKRGNMLPSDIVKLEQEYILKLTGKDTSPQASNSPLQEVLDRYSEFSLHDPFPSAVWWKAFFDKGIIDTQELEQFLLSSKYFHDENTPNWIKLWHFYDLPDDDFDPLLRTVESEFSDRKFEQLGVIKHVTGLFLVLSDAGLYDRSKEEILRDSKLYIDYLKDNNRSAFLSPLAIKDLFDAYLNLGFQGRELKEFKEFISYINDVRMLAEIEELPHAAQTLLDRMQSNVWEFHSMVCLGESRHRDVQEPRYYDVPIFKYIEPATFLTALLAMKREDQRCVFWALEERYKPVSFQEKLCEELEWLRSVQSLLLEEASLRKGKVSGYHLKSLDKEYLSKIIGKVEVRETKFQASP